MALPVVDSPSSAALARYAGATTLLMWAVGCVCPYLSGCDECDVDEWQCVDNRPEECNCDESPCVWDKGYPECEEGKSCVEDGPVAACVDSVPCPDDTPDSHCTENVAVQCVGGFLFSSTHCPSDRPCEVFEQGAFCGAPPGHCQNGLVDCVGSKDYTICEEGYPASHDCPAGTTCDPSIQSGNPCTWLPDAAMQPVVDAG